MKKLINIILILFIMCFIFIKARDGFMNFNNTDFENMIKEYPEATVREAEQGTYIILNNKKN